MDGLTKWNLWKYCCSDYDRISTQQSFRCTLNDLEMDGVIQFLKIEIYIEVRLFVVFRYLTNESFAISQLLTIYLPKLI